MPDEFQFDVTLTRSEITGYNLYHIRWLLLLILLGLASLIIMTYLSIYHPRPDVRNLLGALLFWMVILLAIGLSQPFIILMQIFVFKSPALEALSAKRVYSFSDEGIHVASLGRSALTPWSRVKGIKDTGRLILIYTGSRLAYLIPRRCFLSTEEKRAFLSFLVRKAKGQNKKPGR